MAVVSLDSLRGSELCLDDTDSSRSHVVSLCDVDLGCLMDEDETTCSPLSETLELNKGGSIFSDDPNYLWYVKQQAELLRKPSNGSRGHRRRYHSDDGSDVSSTCVMVNIKHDTCVNLCDNPSDMWHGLKMSDGMPVVIRSRGKRPAPVDTEKRQWSSNKRRAGGMVTSGTTKNSSGMERSAKKPRKRSDRIGPINYKGGFLSLQNYVGRGNGASHIYRLNTVDPEKVHPSHRRQIRGRQRIHQVQQQLAKARGIVF